MEGNFSNEIPGVYAHVRSWQAISRSSAFAQTFTHERKKWQNVCLNKMSRTVPVRTAALTDKSVLYVTARSNFATTHSLVLKWPPSKDEPNSIYVSFNRLLFSRTRYTELLPIQQENNSLSYVVHTASTFSQTEIVSLAGVEKESKVTKMMKMVRQCQ